MSNAPRFFEDLTTGEIREFGCYRVSEEEIIEFGTRYDPQPFHVDRETAAQSPFRGLIASGWHTCAMMMRMVVEFSMSKDSVMGSPGVDEIRWLKPVRPGDRLSIRQTVVSTERSKSKPDRGVVKFRTEVLNQVKEIVMHATGMIIYRCRSTGSDP
jgi:acyl dehydratase